MKKILIGAMAVTLCVSLAACGTSGNSAAITSLGNQLDETANTISNMQTINPTDLNLTKSMLETIATTDNSSAIYDNVINTQQSILNEEYYKTDILNRTAKIKNNLSKDVKLSKSQTTAVKELTNNLTKYTNSVAYTKNEMTSTIKSIVSLKKNVEKNTDKINAKLNRLACNSNSRSSFYENIINTLEQLDGCLTSDCNNTNKNVNNENINNENINNNTNNNTNVADNTNNTNNENTNVADNNNTNEEKKGLVKNIDSYLPQTNNNENIENCPHCPCNPTTNNNNGINYGINNGMNNNMNYAQNGEFYNSNMPINNPAIGGNVYNRYNRFNPSRNTDTYGPSVRNIDTYGGNDGFGMNGFGVNGFGMNGFGMNGNMGYGMNGGVYNSNNGNRMVNPTLQQDAAMTNGEYKVPEQRLEDFEKVNDNNIVEKMESNTENLDMNKDVKIELPINTIETEQNKILLIKNEEVKSEANVSENVKTENLISTNQNETLSINKNLENNKETLSETEKKIEINNEQTNNLNDTENIQRNENVQKQNENNNTFKQPTNKNTFKGPKIRIVDARRVVRLDKEELDQPIIAHEKTETNNNSNSNIENFNQDKLYATI